MRQRQQHEEAADVVTPAEPTGPTDATEIRVDAERFLAAADEAIEGALSGDSEAFLAASRQTSAQ